jgi:hypothetical protein
MEAMMVDAEGVVTFETISFEVGCAAALLRQARYAMGEMEAFAGSAIEGVALLLDSIVAKADRADQASGKGS